MKIFEKEKQATFESKAGALWQAYELDDLEEKFWKNYQKLISKAKQASKAQLIKSNGSSIRKFSSFVYGANTTRKKSLMKATLHRILGRMMIHIMIFFGGSMLLAFTLPVFLILWIPVNMIVFVIRTIMGLQKHHKRSSLLKTLVIISPGNLERIGGGLKSVKLGYDEILDIKENDLGLHVVVMDKEVTTHAGGVTKDHILKKVAIVFPRAFEHYEKAKEMIYFYKENHDASKKYRLNTP